MNFKPSPRLLLYATIPVIIVAAAIASLVNFRAHSLGQEEVATLEQRVMTDKKTALLDYLSLARAAITENYTDADGKDAQTKDEAKKMLHRLTYGRDGDFFVYDFDGTNLIHLNQPDKVGRNWIDLRDARGTPFIRELINRAKAGGGYLQYFAEHPSSGRISDKISYVIALNDWRWVLGASVFVDDLLEQVRLAEIDVATRFRQNSVIIGVLTVKALIIVFVTGLVFSVQERREADAKLKELTQRIVETQEEERGRVARELHDGISQILVSVKYALELASFRAQHKSDDVDDAIGKGAEGLNMAIREVRRISHDLRPSTLDDLGLSPALKNLGTEFAARTGTDVTVTPMPFRRTLPNDAKTTLYRVAQEALTNIERHAHATRVRIELSLNWRGVVLTVSDNGKGFEVGQVDNRATLDRGIGIRNMRDRLAYHNGELHVYSTPHGTTIEAQLPRSLLSKDTQAAASDSDGEEAWNERTEQVQHPGLAG